MPVAPNKLSILILTILFVEHLSNPTLPFAAPQLIDDFKTGPGPNWEAKEFKGKTSYRPAT
jgi:hypothetical protein